MFSKACFKKSFTACWANGRVALWRGFAPSRSDASVLWLLAWLRLFFLNGVSRAVVVCVFR